MRLPGTIAEATRNTFSSVVGRPCSASARARGEAVAGGGERVAVERLEAELLGRRLHHLRVGRLGRTPEVAEHRAAVAASIFFQRPWSTLLNACSQYCWLPGRHARPGAARLDHHRELGEHVAVPVEDAGLGHHVDVRADGAAGHREVHHARVGGERDGVEGRTRPGPRQRATSMSFILVWSTSSV
jgi:hypothetical protein